MHAHWCWRTYTYEDDQKNIVESKWLKFPSKPSGSTGRERERKIGNRLKKMGGLCTTNCCSLFLVSTLHLYLSLPRTLRVHMCARLCICIVCTLSLLIDTNVGSRFKMYVLQLMNHLKSIACIVELNPYFCWNKKCEAHTHIYTKQCVAMRWFRYGCP